MKHHHRIRPSCLPSTLVCLLASLLIASGSMATDPAKDSRPNFIVIVADDLGFSDVGFAGSEIRTPNLDSLANEGKILTDFYTAPTCSPTRSMLMSGTDHHLAGLGTMAEVMTDTYRGKPGHEGYLNDKVVTLPTRLREHGYHTYMTGKWHLGFADGQLPYQRGFERSFSLVSGGASHFADRKGMFAQRPLAEYWADDSRLEKLPEDFYSSKSYVDELLRYIRSNQSEGRPFFAYLALTAPHWPLHVPDSHIDLYKGSYDEGWDVWRERRLASMKKAGIVPDDVQTFPRMQRVKAWSDLTAYERQHYARRMEIYAAMIEYMDQKIGELIDYLKSRKEFDNTFVIFFSDNGPEGNDAINIFDNYLWIPGNFDNSLENMGRPGSYVSQGTGWAQVSAVPFRLFKSFPSEGGIRVPAFVTHLGKPYHGEHVDELLSVTDIAPTLLDLAGVDYQDPDHYPGKLAITGRSFSPMLASDKGAGENAEDQQAARVLGWELFGRAGLRRGDLKALRIWEPFGPGKWQLYDLARDPSELHDLAGEMPEALQSLVEQWHGYAEENGVVIVNEDAGYAD